MHRRIVEFDDAKSQMSLICSQEHDQYVLAELMTFVESHFAASAWAAFQLATFEGVKPNVAAEKLGISLNVALPDENVKE